MIPSCARVCHGRVKAFNGSSLPDNRQDVLPAGLPFFLLQMIIVLIKMWGVQALPFPVSPLLEFEMRRIYWSFAALAVLSFANPALASPPPVVMQVDADSIDQDQTANSAFLGSRSQAALGNMWGLRPWLSPYGLSFNLLETS